MSKVNTEPFKFEHIDLLELREHERETLFELPGGPEMLEGLAEHSTAVTLFVDGKAVCVYGYYEMWPGVCEVFLLPSVYVPLYSQLVLRRVKQGLKNLEGLNYFHRIQITSLDDELHCRFIKWLGFEEEGVMRAYTNKKENYKMWSRVSL